MLEEEPTTIKPTSDVTKHNHIRANGPEQNKDAHVAVETDRGVNTSHILGSDMVLVRPNTIQDKYPADLTELLPADLKELPRSDVISLTSDPSLSLSSCRVFRDESLLLVIFISNCTDTVITDVAVQLTCEGLEVCKHEQLNPLRYFKVVPSLFFFLMSCFTLFKKYLKYLKLILF